jgi:hypothetical protein
MVSGGTRAPPAHLLVPIQIGRVAYVLRDDGTKWPVQSIELSLLVTAMGTEQGDSVRRNHGRDARVVSSTQHGGSGVRGEVGREDDRGTNKAYAESGMDRLGGSGGAIWSAHANERKNVYRKSVVRRNKPQTFTFIS